MRSPEIYSNYSGKGIIDFINKLQIVGRRRFWSERRQLTEMHGPRCAYCHRYFLDSELSVDHIVPRALSGESIIRNTGRLCHQCHRMKDQPSTKLIQKNACIIKARIFANYPLPNTTRRLLRIHHYHHILPEQYSERSNNSATDIIFYTVSLARLYSIHTIYVG